MIISHVHKYVFVELPFTGTTSIRSALLEHYNGIRILHRHATYNEFYRTATPEQKKYFVFSCIRNPLDVAVTDYAKHKSGFGEKVNVRIKKSKGMRRLINGYRLGKIDFAMDANADFSDYFLRYYKLPYDDWSAVSHARCDFVIRFERLQEDFEKALELIGIKEKITNLPVTNKTAGKQDDFLSSYSAEAIARAKYVFAPYMDKWNYQFPLEWGEATTSWRTRKQYEALNLFRKFGWLHLKPLAARWAKLEN
jgi:hypothetical protein